MVHQECDQILASKIDFIINQYLRNIVEFKQKIINCYYKCCKSKFITWGKIRHANETIDNLNFILESAFTDSILKFNEHVEQNRIYNRNVKLTTILMAYYKITILSLLQKEKRDFNNKEKYNLENPIENFQIDAEFIQIKEEKYKKLEVGLSKLEPIDKQIIIWKHLELKSVDEIAKLLGIKKEAASNRIYRCMIRLKGLI